MATKKKVKASKSKQTKKAPAKKPTLLLDEADDDGDFVLFDDQDHDFEQVSSSEPMLSLGQRLGTITMLETIPSESLPAVAQKAGFEMKLQGSKICLTEKGQPLSLAELIELGEWLLLEAQKACEQYSIDLGA